LSFHWVLRKQLSPARIDLFEILTDRQGLAKRYGLLSYVLVLDDQGRYHLSGIEFSIGGTFLLATVLDQVNWSVFNLLSVIKAL